MRKLYVALLSVLPVLFAGPLVAQNPDLSGGWVLNLSKSFLGKEHLPSNYTLTKLIRQDGATVQITDIAAHVAIMNIPMADSKTTQTLIPDGNSHASIKPAPFPGMPPQAVQLITTWQGNTMVIDESSAGGMQGVSDTHTRYYLAEPNVLIELVRGSDGFGDSEQRFVFERRP